MKWLEIIEIRSVGSNRELLETHLQNLINEGGQEANLQAVKVYKHSTLETDFSIHLYYNSEKTEVRKSHESIRLVSSLKEYGLINHTIWVEQPHHQ